MILLTNTHSLTPSSPKDKKAVLWRANYRQLTSPLTPEALALILPTAYATYCGSINPATAHALSSNSDTSEYNKTADINPLSPFRTIDIETSTEDLGDHTDYIDPSPKPPRLTEADIFQRLRHLPHTSQHSDSSTPSDLRYHTHLCFSRSTGTEQSWSLISRIFPETCIPNYIRNIRIASFDLNIPFTTKPLYIDIVSKRPKQKMYVSHSLFASNRPTELISIKNNSDRTDHLDTNNPTNLLRLSLINAYKTAQVTLHGTLQNARDHYLTYGDQIDPDTPLYDKQYNLMGTIAEVINDPAYYGKNCNYGRNPDWYNPSYGTQQSKREYLQVAQSGGYLTDHVAQERVQLIHTDKPDRLLTSNSRYIGDSFSNVLLEHPTHYAYGLIASTGSGKTYSFRNRPNHILLVPQNKQVKAERDGYTICLSEEQALNTPDSYTSIEDAIRDGHTTLVMTYDKFAGHLSRRDRTYLNPFTIICDEIHEFLLSSSSYDGTRDQLFNSFRANQYHRLIFMSATLAPRFFKDIIPDMDVTQVTTVQHRPETHIVSGLDYHDFMCCGSLQQGLNSIINSETHTVVWLNHINKGKAIIYHAYEGLIPDIPRTAKHIYGASEDNPADIIDSQPSLLVMTSAVKQGFSINYPVDTYIVYIDPFNNYNTYTLDEIEQITARCRNAKKLIIVVNPNRYHPLNLRPTPSQAEVIEGGVLAKEGKSIEEISALLMSDYAPLLKNAVVEEDETMPAFYLSERIILGNRVLQSSLADSFNLTRMGLKVNGVAPEVHPLGVVVHSFPTLREPYNLVAMINRGKTLEEIDESVTEAYFPDGLLTPTPALNNIELPIWERFEECMTIFRRETYTLNTMKLMLTNSTAWTGYHNKKRIKDMKQILLPEEGQILATSTLPRLWNNKDPAIQKLGGANKMTASKAIKILKTKLHQEAIFIHPIMQDRLKELKWSKKNQAKYYPTYKGSERKDSTIGWLCEVTDEFYKASKKDSDGQYPIGAKVLFINKEYLQ